MDEITVAIGQNGSARNEALLRVIYNMEHQHQRFGDDGQTLRSGKIQMETLLKAEMSKNAVSAMSSAIIEKKNRRAKRSSILLWHWNDYYNSCHVRLLDCLATFLDK